MTWDATAVKVATKSIGQVESGMKYDAVNPTDPITVGIFQWFGTRAASILIRMKTENPSSWTGVGAALAADITAHSGTDAFWNTRYLTAAEVASIKPVLVANVAIQDNQASVDLTTYKNVAVAQGMDADANTDAVIFFCNMYNQSPREALRVLAVAGPESSLDRLYAYCLNNTVLGRYRTRYRDAYNIILAHDTTGVGTGATGTVPVTPGDGGSGTRPTTDIKYLQKSGAQFVMKFKDGHSLFFVPSTSGVWVPQADNAIGAPDVPPPTSTPPSGVQTLLRNYMLSKTDVYAYSQGASRLTPDKNMSTDCSGLVYWAYKTIANTYIGTWTGNQIGYGTLVTKDKATAIAETGLVVGDLIFYRWSSGSPATYDHVDMYIGGGQVSGHGGPDPGPDVMTMSGRISAADSIMVRRYV